MIFMSFFISKDEVYRVDLDPGYLILLKRIKEHVKKIKVDRGKNKREGCQKKYLDIMVKIRETKPDTDICENQWERLMIEKSVLGVFASRHPITLFPSVRECGAVDIKRL